MLLLLAMMTTSLMFTKLLIGPINSKFDIDYLLFNFFSIKLSTGASGCMNFLAVGIIEAFFVLKDVSA